MNCKTIEILIIDYIEGTTTREQTIEVEKHLKSCKQCYSDYVQTKLLLDDMNSIPDEQPNPQMSMDFYQALEEEKSSINNSSKVNGHITINQTGNFLKYAAAILVIFGSGLLLGKNIQWKSQQNEQYAYMRDEIVHMKQNMSLVSLVQPTTSQRLQAVDVLDQQLEEDDKVIQVLIQTLNNDDNINVRMAAANAMSKYTGNKIVKDALIDALATQKDPAIQITLINIIIKIHDERAKELFRNILENENALPVVKQQAKEGLKVFA